MTLSNFLSILGFLAYSAQGYPAALEDLDLLIDSPRSPVNRVLIMGAEEANTFQGNLVRTLNAEGVEVIFTMPDFGTPLPIPSTAPGTRPLRIHFPTGLWSQDRFFRFKDRQTGKSVLLPSITDSIFDDGSPNANEMAIPQLLVQQIPDKFTALDKSPDLVPVSVDRRSGYPYVGQVMPGFVQGEAWKLVYGDGGDRLTTEHFLLIGKSTYEKLILNVRAATGITRADELHFFVEKLFRKKILPLGESRLADQYLYHLDMFLTPVENSQGQLTLLFGSVDFTLKNILKTDLDHLPIWAERDFWANKIAKEEKLKNEIRALGIRVVDIPIVFATPESYGVHGLREVVASFNNGLFLNQKFLCARYRSNRADLNAVLAQSEEIASTAFAKWTATRMLFVEGGESIIKYGGGIRCMSAALMTRDNEI